MTKGRQSVRRETPREFFIQIPAFLEYLSDLDPFAWRLYAHYLRVCGEVDSCYEYTATTSRLCSMSERTIRYRRQTLADLNLISFWYEGRRGDERVNVIIRDVWGVNAKFLRLLRTKSVGEWVEPWIRGELAKIEPIGEEALSDSKQPPASDAGRAASKAAPPASKAAPPAPDADIERSLSKIPEKDPLDNDKIDLPSTGKSVPQPESSRRSRRDVDSNFAEVCTAYENEIGSLTVMSADELGALLDEHSKDLIIDAIRVAVKQNARKLSYVSATLSNWKRDGRGGKPNRPTTYANGAAKPATATALVDMKLKDWLLKFYNVNHLPSVIDLTGKSETEIRDEFKQWRVSMGLPPG